MFCILIVADKKTDNMRKKNSLRLRNEYEKVKMKLKIVLVLYLLNVCAGYDVGVDYHSIGTNFTDSTFIKQYHLPTIRSVVLTHLQGMANSGATFIFLHIWLVAQPNTATDQNWKTTFPMSDQEMSNLNQFSKDVASIRSTIDHHPLFLDICLLWLGSADYQMGSPQTGLGYDRLSANEFTLRVFKTMDKVVQAVSNIKRSDGILVVQTIYLDGEVMIGAKPNQQWFLSTHYPRFVQIVSAAGFTPSIYFLADAEEDHVLQDDYIDATFPALNGHRSMYWIYRSLYFLTTNQLPVPPRIDFSCYVNRINATYTRLIHHILDDATGSLWAVSAPDRYGIAETYYFPDAGQRKAIGQAFAAEAMNNNRLNRLSFWTTPDAGGKGVDVAYPFAIQDYLPLQMFFVGK